MNKYENVKIAGKEMPVAFNRYALGELMSDLGVDIQGLNNLKEDLKTIQKFAYYGLVGGYAAKHGEQLPMTYMQACLELFEDEKGIGEIMAIFGKQQPASEADTKKAGNGEKKP